MCKQGRGEKVVKDGSNDVLICEKCYYCSKCKTNQAIARSVVNENKILYEGTICETCIKEVIKSANEQTCEMCGEHAEKIIRLSTRSGYNGKGICGECEKKLPDKPHEEKNNPQHNKYLCESCGKSCWKDKGDQGACYYQKRITHWYTDFRKTVNYFCLDGDYGNSVKKGNSKCAEEFKKEHQQTCSNCNKTEWPDMAKGWMLDYEISKAFCSFDCHVKYRNLSWEQASQLTQIETLPPELELSSGDRKDFDWEKEGSKKEILYWRESVKELQRQLEESKKKSPSQRHPNEIPHQARQISYLLKLHQNTQKKSEQAYQTKYGKAELDALIGSNSDDKGDKEKGMSGGMIFLIIIGVVALVGTVVYLLKKGRRGKKKP